MNIYSQKQLWKLILSGIALLIVGASLWYSNVLVSRIAQQERQQAKLWAQAIDKKANLVKYTNELFQKLENEERKKVELWVAAIKQLSKGDFETDYSFVTKVIENNTTVPVILADDQGNIVSHLNLDSTKSQDKQYLQEQLNEMQNTYRPIEIAIYGDKKNYVYYKNSRLFEELKRVLDDLIKSFISESVINSASVPVLFTDENQQEVLEFGNIDSSQINSPAKIKQIIDEMAGENPPLKVDLGDGVTNYIFYRDSSLLTQLKFYPYVQFGIIALFILIGYWLFSTARRSEQNQVWVGLAKETAHQLGTPLSSLMAWMELMKTKDTDPQMLQELEKDINRLETITERFSKIGSTPTLDRQDVYTVLTEAVNYMKSRSSDKVSFTIECEDKDITACLNVPLFEWVIENLCKNAIDAMGGSGSLHLEIIDQIQVVYIDVTDTGKGIPASKHKTVFQPGYTTKQRGWGLGLSLTKRIIENYHSGKIFVKRSEPNKGTTFRIVLNKN